MVQGGQEVPHCSICGLVLDDDEAPSETGTPGRAALAYVLIAEDSPLICNAVADMLESQHIAMEVGRAANGVEFVSQATARFRQQGKLSLAILDVEMPIMNGVQAARSLRDLERQLHVPRKTPVLFFTSRKIDERFKQILQQLQPSSFVNKGTSTDPEHLAQRVRKVLSVLLPGKVPAA
ncbi:MAG: response regulator [Candidatus Dadabacteria bacterium]|nr:MAG: response regulator [Candidatus Dadabacteria bacterium]